VLFSRVYAETKKKFSSWQIKRATRAKAAHSVKSAAKKERPAVHIPADRPALKQDSISIPKDQGLDLCLNITDDVWAEIKRDGHIIFSGTLKKATIRNWQADEGFEIWTGNASAIEVTLNGYNLGPVGRGVKRGVIVNRQGISK
jgi:hypothetical protein